MYLSVCRKYSWYWFIIIKYQITIVLGFFWFFFLNPIFQQVGFCSCWRVLKQIEKGQSSISYQSWRVRANENPKFIIKDNKNIIILDNTP